MKKPTAQVGSQMRFLCYSGFAVSSRAVTMSAALSRYIVPNCDSGSGLTPSPASTVYPGRL